MAKKKENIEFSNEDGSTYDFSGSSFYNSGYPEDKIDFLMNREGRFKLIREMLATEAIVGAFKNLVESTICSEKYKMKPADTSEEAKYYSDLIWDMLNDLEKPFVEYIKDWSSSADYGFCLSEIVLKKRLGYNPQDPRKHSKYNDGFIAPRKFAPRPQETIDKWNYDRFKRIESVEQRVNYSQPETIPYSKLLHFTVKSYNDNPEGTSVFKNIVENYIEKKKAKKIQLINYARGINGIPVISMPFTWADKSNSKYASIRSSMESAVKNMRRGQDAGLVLPSVRDQKGNELLTFRIEGSGSKSGSGSGEDGEKIIDRRDREMSTSLLADFFLSGKTASVSGTLGQIKVEIFSNFILSILNNIVGQVNHKLIPLIFELNGWDMQYMPMLTHTNLSKLNMTNIMLYTQSLAKSGLTAKSYERDIAMTNFVFDGILPELSREEYERNQQLNEVNYVDNLDSATIDDFEDVSGKNTNKEE